jgi:hypothetical protein
MIRTLHGYEQIKIVLEEFASVFDCKKEVSL